MGIPKRAVRVYGGTRAAYADFRPNNAKLELGKKSSEGSKARHPKSASGSLDDKALDHEKQLRLCQLLPLLIEAGSYCHLLREARDVFVDGHFYACVAMCGISLERFQRDKAEPCGGTRKQKISQIRKILQRNKTLTPKTLALCKRMADLRNNYAHGHGLSPKADALKALGWMRRFIRDETDLMQDYVILDGILHRKRSQP